MSEKSCTWNTPVLDIAILMMKVIVEVVERKTLSLGSVVSTEISRQRGEIVRSAEVQT